MADPSFRVAALCVSALLSLLHTVTPAYAQSGSRKVQLSTADPEWVSEHEIIVKGIRLLDEEQAPIKAESFGLESSASRGHYLRAEMFARCADKPRLDLLRKVIDGPPNAASSRQALDSLIRTNVGCYADFPRPTLSPPELGTCHPEMTGNLQIGPSITLPSGRAGSSTGPIEAQGTVMCRALYTRGAVIEQVLRTYAPELRLTQEETQSVAAHDRFVASERNRNRFRLDRDKVYFAVTSCLVQATPELATMLLRSSPASDLSHRIQLTMYAAAPRCVNYAEKVEADPSQFRAYIAESVYRWIVAARGVDTLLPAED